MPKSRLELVAPVPDENAIKKSIIQFLVYKGAIVLKINSGAAAGQYQDKQGYTKKRYVEFVHWYAQGVSFNEGKAGVSDILALLPLGGGLSPFGDPQGLYRFVFIVIETKTPQRKDEVTEAQRRFMAEVEARGGIAIIATGIEDVEAALESASRRGVGVG